MPASCSMTRRADSPLTMQRTAQATVHVTSISRPKSRGRTRCEWLCSRPLPLRLAWSSNLSGRDGVRAAKRVKAATSLGSISRQPVLEVDEQSDPSLQQGQSSLVHTPYIASCCDLTVALRKANSQGADGRPTLLHCRVRPKVCSSSTKVALMLPPVKMLPWSRKGSDCRDPSAAPASETQALVTCLMQSS